MSQHYKKAGVDIHQGDKASHILYQAARKTWKNRSRHLGEVITPFDDFTGLRVMAVGKLPAGTVLGVGFDGVGTKVEIGERIAHHHTIAFDLFAMVCDDAVVRGGEPVLVGTVLDVNTLGKEDESYLNFIKQLADGYVKAAREAGVAVINGELAELGVRVTGYGPFNYNWSAGVIWFARQDRMFTGFEIKPGDALVGLQEEGFRSNGLSLARQILRQNFGEEWHTKSVNGKKLGELALKPSRIYTRAIVDMIGGVEGKPQAKVHGVAHITGGGIPGKLGRILKPRKLGAQIDSPFPPGDIVSFCQALGNVSDREAYRAWNMGQGMIVVTPEPEPVIRIARDHGIKAKISGRVTQTPGITIVSQGAFKKDKVLKFS
ncbi:MAG: AIR synthase-related protein [Thermodesulfobacteriota bacterium]|jgi:phosphoribosylformylglycinamidine cyclo-ligase|nr:MAG: AIR synthase-related protein [Thermodesulfobacteriota bacterium]